MKIFLLTLTFLLMGAPIKANEAKHYVNGKWFDGDTFQQTTFYSQNGFLTKSKPKGDIETVDLKGGWVIPPLAEAHIHNLSQAETLDEQIKRYLDHGIYYVMVQGAIFMVTPDMKSKVNLPNSIDAIYTQCALTVPTYGTVRELFIPLMKQGAFGNQQDVRELDGLNLCFVENEEDLDKKLDIIQKQGSDFVKVHLAFSEIYEERFGLPEADGIPTSAINPEYLPLIVQKAHSRGLKVSSHVETAGDFEIAANAGVDYIAHLPGWRVGSAAGFEEGDLSPMILSDEQAQMAKESGSVLITTSYPKSFLPNYEANIENLKKLHGQNLGTLKRNGVRIAIGSDSQAELTRAELNYIANLNVFTNLELLKLAVENTPKAIFPDRKIGHLTEGFEANFIVLRESPLENIMNIEDITLRVKAGGILKN